MICMTALLNLEVTTSSPLSKKIINNKIKNKIKKKKKWNCYIEILNQKFLKTKHLPKILVL